MNLGFRPRFGRKLLKMLSRHVAVKTDVVLNNAATCSITLDESACVRVLIARVRYNMTHDLDRPCEVRGKKGGRQLTLAGPGPT